MLQALMAIFATIATILKYLPDAIKLGYQVWDFIRDSMDKAEQKDKISKLKEAIKEAKNTQDTSKLEDIFGPIVEDLGEFKLVHKDEYEHLLKLAIAPEPILIPSPIAKPLEMANGEEEKKSPSIDLTRIGAKISLPFSDEHRTAFIQEMIKLHNPSEKAVLIDEQYSDSGVLSFSLPGEEESILPAGIKFESRSMSNQFGGAFVGASFIQIIRMRQANRMGSTFQDLT